MRPVLLAISGLALAACGDAGRDSATSQTSAQQPTSASVGSFTAGVSSSSGDAVPTGSASEVTTGADTTSAVDEDTSPSTSTTTDTANTTTTISSDTVDPSVGDTEFELPDCVEVLQATVRDFRSDHPDFEAFTSDFGLKGLVQPQLGPDSKPVYAHPGPTEQTAGPEFFGQWYNNTPDVNIAFAVELTLTEVAPGLFSYENNAFFPIDDQGWGNQGNPHNFHFTTEVHTTFTYKGGEVFTFIGDDDLWLFLNDRLAIDLGGVHPELSASVELDAVAQEFGLQVGGTYALDLFHAERHTVDSNFRIDTSIQCFLIPG